MVARRLHTEVSYGDNCNGTAGAFAAVVRSGYGR
jgi:hypothetical protein